MYIMLIQYNRSTITKISEDTITIYSFKLHYLQADMIDRNVLDFVHPFDVDRVMQHIPMQKNMLSKGTICIASYVSSSNHDGMHILIVLIPISLNCLC